MANGNNAGLIERARERFGLSGNGPLGLGGRGSGLLGYGLTGSAAVLDVPSTLDEWRERFARRGGAQPAGARVDPEAAARGVDPYYPGPTDPIVP